MLASMVLSWFREIPNLSLAPQSKGRIHDSYVQGLGEPVITLPLLRVMFVKHNITGNHCKC